MNLHNILGEPIWTDAQGRTYRITDLTSTRLYNIMSRFDPARYLRNPRPAWREQQLNDVVREAHRRGIYVSARWRGYGTR
jgi:hypothetical protein